MNCVGINMLKVEEFVYWEWKGNTCNMCDQGTLTKLSCWYVL